MKRFVAVFCVLVLMVSVIIPVNASIELDNETLYGKRLVSEAYYSDTSGEVEIEGVYGARDGEYYVITVVYENGEMLKVNANGVETILASSQLHERQYNDDEYSLVSDRNPELFKFKNNAIRYYFKDEYIEKEGMYLITLFLFDEVSLGDMDKNITVSIYMDKNDFTDFPTVDDLSNGFYYSGSSVDDDIARVAESSPVAWAEQSISELILAGNLRDEAFGNYQGDISRLDFIYLMVQLYERMMDTEITVDETITFTDTDDVFALKAGTIGITNGIGNGAFGPEESLTREQLVTMIVRTLTLAGKELDPFANGDVFEDESEFSSWAKEAIYLAQANNIVNGMGNNKFGPKDMASNEMGLVLYRRLAEQHSVLRWLELVDGERVYLKADDELYKIPFTGNVIVDVDHVDANDLYFDTNTDMELFINTMLDFHNGLKYESVDNPNIKGTLTVKDHGKVSTSTSIVYSGVDKAGEKQTTEFTGITGSVVYESVVRFNNELEVEYKKGLREVSYYEDNKIMDIVTFPVDSIVKAYGYEYVLDYNEEWDIYTIEFMEISEEE